MKTLHILFVLLLTIGLSSLNGYINIKYPSIDNFIVGFLIGYNSFDIYKYLFGVDLLKD